MPGDDGYKGGKRRSTAIVLCVRACLVEKCRSVEVFYVSLVVYVCRSEFERQITRNSFRKLVWNTSTGMLGNMFLHVPSFAIESIGCTEKTEKWISSKACWFLWTHMHPGVGEVSR